MLLPYGLLDYSYLFFAVLAARLKLALVGAPLLPGLRIVSPLPAFILRFLAAMLAYNPGLAIVMP